MRETHGYLELVVEVAEKQLSQPSEGCISKVIALLAEEALCITKRWNKLKRKVLWKYLVYILQTTGMPNLRYGPRYNLTRFSSQFNNSNNWFICRISQDDFLDRVIATPDKLINLYGIRDLPSGYLAPFLVANAFLGTYRLGSNHIYTDLLKPLLEK